MMKRLYSLSLLALLGCASPSPEELAALAAKGYYDHLIHGEYEQFLEGLDSQGHELLAMPEAQDYRSQLLDSYRQFMAQQNADHRGIREIRVVNATTDTIQKYTNVFLVLCLGDSTNEEIVVPMVERNGSWRMK